MGSHKCIIFVFLSVLESLLSQSSMDPLEEEEEEWLGL